MRTFLKVITAIAILLIELYLFIQISIDTWKLINQYFSLEESPRIMIFGFIMSCVIILIVFAFVESMIKNLYKRFQWSKNSVIMMKQLLTKEEVLKLNLQENEVIYTLIGYFEQQDTDKYILKEVAICKGVFNGLSTNEFGRWDVKIQDVKTFAEARSFETDTDQIHKSIVDIDIYVSRDITDVYKKYTEFSQYLWKNLGVNMK